MSVLVLLFFIELFTLEHALLLILGFVQFEEFSLDTREIHGWFGNNFCFKLFARMRSFDIFFLFGYVVVPSSSCSRRNSIVLDLNFFFSFG